MRACSDPHCRCHIALRGGGRTWDFGARDEVEHGTLAGYAAGCRDRCCREAMTQAKRELRARARVIPREESKG